MARAKAQTQTPGLQWSLVHTVILVVILICIPVLGLLIPMENILLKWLVNLVLLVLFTMCAGGGITRNYVLGWLIDEQYTMSLSRLQMFLWTVVVLSAFVTAVFVNIQNGNAGKSVDIAIPDEVWIAMGISTTSLVASPLILSTKKRKNPNVKDAERTLMQLDLISRNTAPATKADALDAYSSGQIFQNKEPEDARLYDLVRGEETSNADVLDLARLQNLFFTIILVGTYAASLGGFLMSSVTPPSGAPISWVPPAIVQFPDLAASSVALLAISHAGYLVSKAATKQTA
jgi:hypothetical protein